MDRFLIFQCEIIMLHFMPHIFLYNLHSHGLVLNFTILYTSYFFIIYIYIDCFFFLNFMWDIKILNIFFSRFTRVNLCDYNPTTYPVNPT